MSSTISPEQILKNLESASRDATAGLVTAGHTLEEARRLVGSYKGFGRSIRNRHRWLATAEVAVAAADHLACARNDHAAGKLAPIPNDDLPF